MTKLFIRLLLAVALVTGLLAGPGSHTATAHAAAGERSSPQLGASSVSMATDSRIDNAACTGAGDAQKVVDELKAAGLRLGSDAPGTVQWVLQYAANACGCVTDLRTFDAVDAWSDCGGAGSTIIFLIQQYTSPPQVS